MKRGTTGAWGPGLDWVETSVGANVTHWRQVRGLTQAQLAQVVGIEIKTLQRIEAGYGNVTARVLVAIQLALYVPLRALFDPRDLKPRKRGRPRKADMPIVDTDTDRAG